MYSEFQNFERIVIPDEKWDFEYIKSNNGKRILVASAGNIITEVDLLLLQNIMKAKSLDLKSDIALLPVENINKLRIVSLLKKCKINKLLVFGIQLKELGIFASWKLYESLHIDKYEILVAHSLKELQTNKQYKRLLWDQLKSWEI